MKSNMEYLREFIEDNNEAIEFWEVVAKEIKEAEDEIKNLKEEVEDHEEEIDGLNEELGQLRTEKILQNTIDCGIGVINYEEPENLQLQSIMEEFKEEMECRFKSVSTI